MRFVVGVVGALAERGRVSWLRLQISTPVFICVPPMKQVLGDVALFMIILVQFDFRRNWIIIIITSICPSVYLDLGAVVVVSTGKGAGFALRCLRSVSSRSLTVQTLMSCVMCFMSLILVQGYIVFSTPLILLKTECSHIPTPASNFDKNSVIHSSPGQPDACLSATHNIRFVGGGQPATLRVLKGSFLAPFRVEGYDLIGLKHSDFSFVQYMKLSSGYL
jgi:hypothetical protein